MIDCSNYSLLAHNTFGIDVLCRRFVQIESIAEAQQLLPSLATEKLLIIGAGSNLLLTRDFCGVVVRSGIKGISATNDEQNVLLRCGSGEVWDNVVAFAVQHDLHGAENLSLIPGDVGASAVQNIGAYGTEIAELIHNVEAIEVGSGQQFTFSREECRYGYRDSRFKHDWRGRFFITHVTYRLSHIFNPQLHYGNIRQALKTKGIINPSAEQVRQIIIDIRQEKLPNPIILGNAGSFFTNPIVARDTAEKLQNTYPNLPVYEIDAEHVKLSAGWLVEQCGYKGETFGRVGVSEKTALVLVNRGGATGEEVLNLCQTIQRDVFERFSVRLIPEVNIV